MFLSFSLISCSKDEDEPSVDNSLIVGVWNLEEHEYSGTTSVSQGGTSMETTYTGETYDIDARIILNSDNTFRTEGSYSIRLTTNFEGESWVDTYTFSDVTNTGTYRIENNKIISEGNTPQQPGQGQINMAVSEGTIAELTANRLVIVFDQDYTQEQQGINMNISLQGQQVLSR